MTMGYQEYAVCGLSAKKLYDLFQKPGVLTGLSEPLCYAKAMKDFPADPDWNFPGLSKDSVVLIMGGERHGTLVETDSLKEDEKAFLQKAVWVPLEAFIKGDDYSDLFTDIPLCTAQIDPGLVEQGILDEYGTITGPEDLTLLWINGEHLVSIGDTEGTSLDEETIFAFHTGDHLTDLEDGVLPDGEVVKTVKLAIL